VSAPASRTAGAERWVWAGLALLLGVIVVAAAVSWSRRVPPPDILGAIPDFALTERSGQPITRAALDGQPWIADFIFTRCTGMCPALSTRMAELRRRIDEAGFDARFVSFSVDPTYDTPSVLTDYAKRFGAGDDWLFVTGSRDALYQLIGGGFRLSVAERAPEAVASEGGELITHSDRFVLVDGEGRIRGYYHGEDPDLVPAVLRDLGALHAEAGH
jgi:protein SCO1/2